MAITDLNSSEYEKKYWKFCFYFIVINNFYFLSFLLPGSVKSGYCAFRCSHHSFCQWYMCTCFFFIFGVFKMFQMKVTQKRRLSSRRKVKIELKILWSNPIDLLLAYNIYIYICRLVLKWILSISILIFAPRAN